MNHKKVFNISVGHNPSITLSDTFNNVRIIKTKDEIKYLDSNFVQKLEYSNGLKLEITSTEYQVIYKSNKLIIENNGVVTFENI